MAAERRIVPRSEWGAQYDNGVGNRPVGSLEKYLHHTVTKHLRKNASAAAEKAQMRAVESIGEQRFLRGISYTFAIFPSGRIYAGADVHRISYHSGPGRNVRGVGIVLVGNYEANDMTDAQVESLAWLLQEGVREGWWNDPAITEGHRDFKATACPGKNAYDRIDEINALGRGGSVEPPKPAPKPDPAPTPKPKSQWPDVELRQDGQFGPLTKKALQRMLAGIKIYTGRIDGDFAKMSVTALQRWLTRMGPYKRYSIDGKWGYYTTRALQSFLRTKRIGQGRYGGLRDGVFGPVTIKALQEFLNFQRRYYV